MLRDALMLVQQVKFLQLKARVQIHTNNVNLVRVLLLS